MSRGSESFKVSCVVTVEVPPGLDRGGLREAIDQRCRVAALTLREAVEQALDKRAARAAKGGGDGRDAVGPASL
jgi:hypothetical protein